MQYVPRLTQPSRALVVPLMAATLGAGVATATFAVVNIEDEASVSLPTPAVQSAPPSDAVAGQRNDGGPAEGTAQRSMRLAVDSQATKASAGANVAPRYDGGPDEGSSAGAIAQPAPPQPTPFSGTRP